MSFSDLVLEILSPFRLLSAFLLRLFIVRENPLLPHSCVVTLLKTTFLAKSSCVLIDVAIIGKGAIEVLRRQDITTIQLSVSDVLSS